MKLFVVLLAAVPLVCCWMTVNDQGLYTVQGSGLQVGDFVDLTTQSNLEITGNLTIGRGPGEGGFRAVGPLRATLSASVGGYLNTSSTITSANGIVLALDAYVSGAVNGSSLSVATTAQSNGTIVSRGPVSAGSLSAGSVSAQGIRVSGGNVQVSGGATAADIHASGVAVTGGFTATSIGVSNSATLGPYTSVTGNAVIRDAITGQSSSARNLVSGTVVAQSISSTGTGNVGLANVSGTITAGTLSASQLNAASASVSGGVSFGSAVFSGDTSASAAYVQSINATTPGTPISVQGSVRFGNSVNATCNSANIGALATSPALNNSLVYCDGNTWMQLSLTTNCPAGTNMNFQNGAYTCGLSGVTNLNDTMILNQTQVDRINSWIGGLYRRRWINCFRKNRDGGLVATMHAKCDQRGSALLIIARNNDPTVGMPIFGGYVELNILKSTGSNNWRGGAPSFLFQVYPNFAYFPALYQEFALQIGASNAFISIGDALDLRDNAIITRLANNVNYHVCDNTNNNDGACNMRFSGVSQGSTMSNFELEIFYDSDY